MASQWSTTFALLFVGVFLLLAFFEVSGVGVYRVYWSACVRACVRACVCVLSRVRVLVTVWVVESRSAAMLCLTVRARGRPSCPTTWA